MIFLQLFLHPFELSAPHIFQVHAFRLGRRRFVKENRNPVAPPQFISHIPRQRDAIIQRPPFYRNKRNHIRRSHPRMRTPMKIHVDQFDRLARAQNRRLRHGVRLSRQSNHAAVVVRVHFVIQHPHSRHAAHRLDQRIHLGLIAPLAKIRHTLNQSSHIPSFYSVVSRSTVALLS